MRAAPIFASLATLLAFFSFAPSASAQRARVFVSVLGIDSGSCQATVPCRTFAFAQTAVLPGGEISVLDTGGYGTIIITQALSIVAPPGIEASIAAPQNGVAMTINAGPNDKVSLRGLTLDGAGSAQSGIAFNSGASLTIEDCIIRNMTGAGLFFISNTTTTETLSVSNSRFNDNTGNQGVYILSFSSGAVNASFDRAEFSNNHLEGLDVQTGGGTITIAVTDSVAASNGDIAFRINSGNVGAINLSLTHCLIANNSVGVEAAKVNATIWLAQSTLTGNAAGYMAGIGGVVNSFGDNYFVANGPNTGLLGSATRQ